MMIWGLLSETVLGYTEKIHPIEVVLQRFSPNISYIFFSHLSHPQINPDGWGRALKPNLDFIIDVWLPASYVKFDVLLYLYKRQHKSIHCCRVVQF